MSGGSLNYAFSKLDNIVEDINRELDKKSVLHKAFIDHLKKVSKALYDLEWVISGDKSDGAEEESIKDVISPACILETATKEARKALHDLHKILSKQDGRADAY